MNADDYEGDLMPRFIYEASAFAAGLCFGIALFFLTVWILWRNRRH
jgi:hypothetical protein